MSSPHREPELVRCPLLNIKPFFHICSDAPLSNFYLAMTSFFSQRSTLEVKAASAGLLCRFICCQDHFQVPQHSTASIRSFSSRRRVKQAQMCICQNTDVPMFGLEQPKIKRATQSYWLTQAYMSENALVTPSGCFRASVQPRWHRRSTLIVAVCLAFSRVAFFPNCALHVNKLRKSKNSIFVFVIFNVPYFHTA